MGRLVLSRVVMEQSVPAVKPEKMDDLVEGHPQRSRRTVAVKDIKSPLFQKSRADGVQRDISPDVLVSTLQGYLEDVSQSFLDRPAVFVPVALVIPYLFF